MSKIIFVVEKQTECVENSAQCQQVSWYVHVEHLPRTLEGASPLSNKVILIVDAQAQPLSFKPRHVGWIFYLLPRRLSPQLTV